MYLRKIILVLAHSVIDGQNIADLPNLDQFANPGGQLAGEYHVDIIVMVF